jgi:septal ring factor EnvC (AmiA/AmiB activator)
MAEQDSWRHQVEQQLKDLQYRVAELESSIESVDSRQSQQSYDIQGIDKRLTHHEGRKREKYPHG